MSGWAKLSQLQAGAHVVADGGFTCIPAGRVCLVEADKHGELLVSCSAGGHYLDGQLDEDGDSLIGFTPL